MASLPLHAFALLAASAASTSEGEPDAPVSFGAEVRPILARSCFPCHGFDPSTRRAGLRLDLREHAVAELDGSGIHAILPGDAGASLLLERVAAEDDWDRMPPKGEPLTPDEVDVLRRWIEQGAEYEAHWSWAPLEVPTPPDDALGSSAVGSVAADTRPDGSAEIDAFVDARIAAAGLEPAPLADRRTLLRRLSFDLVGLPPTPDDVRAFEADDTPDAVERTVDRLLASPHFGERWARHWLDLFRYAETYGHEFDYPIPGAWAYRDAVVRAFDADVGFDRMILEHVAGDLLDDRRIDPATGHDDTLLATASWWLGQGTHGPTDVRQDELERIDNQIDVITKAFMATTVSCARCHDHKFDAITQADYYGFAGYLQSSRRRVVQLDPGGAIADGAEELRRLGAELESVLDTELAPTLAALQDTAPALLEGVREVLVGTPREGETTPTLRSLVFEEFDGEDWGNWTVEGDAFSEAPTKADETGLGSKRTARGAAFANTHVRYEGEGSRQADARTGRLTSPRFLVEHDKLHLLIGGGNHPGGTGLRVEPETGEAIEITGHDSLELRAEVLDLRALRGSWARIVVFDDETGGWGNVRVDALVFADEGALDTYRPVRHVEAVADEIGIDAWELERWVAAAQATDPDDLGNPIVALLGGTEETAPAVPSDVGLDGWWFDGEAFGDGRVRAGGWRAPGEGTALFEAAGFDSRRDAAALRGAVRSPTFEIAAPHLHARVRGRGRARLIIDGYHLDEHNPVLFEGVLQKVGSERWHWVTHDLTDYVGHRAYYELSDKGPRGGIALDSLRWSSDGEAPTDAPFGAPAATRAALASALAGARDGDAWGAALVNWMLANELVDAPEVRERRAAFRRAAKALPKPVRVVAMAEGTPEDEFLLVRGDHRQAAEPAPRGFIEALDAGGPAQPDRGSGRLDLARWIVSDGNPLTARVMANRVWVHLFGRGLVASADDFGLLGRPPSHPELLDHLALRLRGELDWSPKALIREIVLSRAYRRAGASAADADPENLLLSHRTPRRLDGESLRDAMLAVSGRLDEKRFGPSVAQHLTPFLTGRGRPQESGPLNGRWRRSLYLETRRNFLDPFFAVFDAPVPFTAQGCRNSSNVPTQSLALMNAPLVELLAEETAKRLADDGDTDDAGRIDALWRLAYGRSPAASERDAALAFLAEWSEDGAAPWADLCHVVFNSKEFSFIQ